MLVLSGLWVLMGLFVLLIISLLKIKWNDYNEIVKDFDRISKDYEKNMEELKNIDNKLKRMSYKKNIIGSDGTMINSSNVIDRESLDYFRFVFDYCSIGILRINAKTLKRERFNPVIRSYFSGLTVLNKINIFEVIDYIIVDKMCEIFNEEINDKKRESVSSYKYVKFKEIDKFAKVTMVAEINKDDTFSYYSFFIHDISDMMDIINGIHNYVEVSCIIRPEIYETLKKMNARFNVVSLA